MLLTQIFIIAISAFNLFKPYVTDTFLPAMGILLGIADFSCGYFDSCSEICDRMKRAPTWMMIDCDIVIDYRSLTGNLFALLLRL